MKRFLSSETTTALVLSVAMAAGTVALRQLALLQPLELSTYDWLIRLRPTAPAPPRVTVVTITEDDIQRLGRWPIPNGVLADALARILEHRPRAVGIDIYLDIAVPPGREQLESVLVGNPNVVAAIKFPRGEGRGVPPPSVLVGSEQLGFTDMLVDPGGIVRRGLLFLDNEEMFATSLALRMAMLYLQADGVYPQPDPHTPEFIRLGNTTIPALEGNEGSYVGADPGGYQYLLDYRDKPRSIPEIPLLELLSGRADPALLRDRAVLVGVAADSVKDVFYVPRSQGQNVEKVIPGVVLHAVVVSQLLRFALDAEQPIRTFHELGEVLWIVLWSLLGGALGFLVRSPIRFAAGAAGGLALLFGIAFGLFTAGWWVPLVPAGIAAAATATMVTAYLSYAEMQERAKLMHLFSRHISKQLAVDIWEHRDQFVSGGHPRPQKLTATVFFSDVASFTTVSEGLDPAELMDWLNRYMSVMTPLVNDHNGVILRFIGDAIMAVFGVPVPRESEAEIAQDAENAVRCAIAMRAALTKHNRELVDEDLPLIGMRIGIFTGEMVAGSIGDMDRLEYNVHGDTVNTGARLESFQKETFVPDYFHDPCRILIGEPTLSRLGDRYRTEPVGEVNLKGKERAVAIYRVIGAADPYAAPVPEVDQPVTRTPTRRALVGD